MKKSLVSLFLLGLMFTFLLCFGNHNPSFKEKERMELSNTANLNENYKALANGSTYFFTDKEKVDDYRAGTISTDTTEITVDSKKNHGTQENPYVIDSVSGWNKFIDNLPADNYGAGAYYVITADLDFNWSIPKCNPFCGTLYGLGHTLSNITFDTTENDSVATGLFRGLSDGAVITDLRTNYKVANTYLNTGGIAGYALDCTILNCVSKGVANQTVASSYSNDPSIGGIIGIFHGRDPYVYDVDYETHCYIYRCTGELTFTCNIADNRNYHTGGLIGLAWNKSYLHISNSYGKVTANISKSLDSVYVAGIIGILSNWKLLEIDNCIGICDASIPASITVAKITGLFSTTYDNTVIKLGPITVMNSYSYGENNSKTVYPTGSWNQNSFTNSITINTPHIYYSGPTTAVDTSKSDLLVVKTPTFCASDVELWQNAKGNGHLKANIWNLNQLAPTNLYQQSPVRNTLQTSNFTVSYYNLKISDGKEQEESLADTTNYTLTEELDLSSPKTTAENHVFMGWTADKTGEGDIYSTLPNNMYGNVKLYAVWDVSTKKVEMTAKNDIVEIEYSAGTIDLIASVTVSDMPNPVTRYQWYKDTNKVTDQTAAQCTLTDVNETGTYFCEYTIYDENEPLWRSRGKTDTKSVKITKGKPNVSTFTLNDTTRPYFGMKLEKVKFDVVVVNKKGQAVEGTASWDAALQKITEGVNTVKIKFAPKDTDNYEEMLLPVEFTSEYITLTYSMIGISREIVVNLEYDQNYSSTKIVKMFNDEIKLKLDGDDTNYQFIKDMAPKFGGVFINEYTGSYTNIQKSETINVTFEEKKFVVTFDPNNGETTTNENYYYGNFILEPTEPTNGDQVFLGWYYETEDSKGNPEKKVWDFDNDRVTKDITLTAEYLSVNLTLESIEVTTVKKDPFIAFDEVKVGELKVVAHYTTDNVDMPTYDKEISFGKYTIAYEAVDGRLHVKKPNVTISYTYDGIKKEVVKELTVDPKNIDDEVSKLAFEDKEVAYTGSVQTIDKIEEGLLPLEIKKVNYTYYLNGTSVEESTLIQPGEYTVIASFEMNSEDYTATNRVATLTIKRATNVTVEWDMTEFSYNGEAQHPKAVFKTSNGSEVKIDFTYTGDIDVKVVGSYKVGVTLNNAAYRIEGKSEVDFEIKKANLVTPTLSTPEPIEYTGSNISLEAYLKDYHKNLMKIEEGGSGLNAGIYTAIITLKDSTNSKWESTSSNSITIEWTIEKKHITAKWDGRGYILTPETTYRPRVNGIIGIADIDKDIINYENDFIYTKDTEKSEAGAYTIEVSLNGEAAWTKNYILDGNTTLNWWISPKEGMTVILIEWDKTEFIYNGEIQHPNATVLDKDGNELTDIQLKYEGDYDTSKWAGEYKAEVSVEENYFIGSGKEVSYTIKTNSEGAGVNPNQPGDSDSSSGTIEEIFNKYPVWQLSVSTLAIILSIVFIIKSLGFRKKRKSELKKIEDLKYKTYSIGVLPELILLSNSFLKLSFTTWTIITCVLSTICLLSLILMLIFRKQYSKTKNEKETAEEEDRQMQIAAEQHRRDEENRRREEENRRRDDELKILLMGIMNGKGTTTATVGANVIDIKEVVTEVVTAILPMMRQLPHNSSDEATQQLLKNQEVLLKKQAEQEALIQKLSKEAEHEVNEEDEMDDEWDSEEEEEDSINEEGQRIALPANFRMRLKESSEKNKGSYERIKNLLASGKKVSYRVCGRVEKFKYQGNLIAVIGVARRAIKVWLSLNPSLYDETRYYQKDVSDKPRYQSVPMLVKISSERGLKRFEELVYELFQQHGIEVNTRYKEKSIQELIFTLKQNKLLKDKEYKQYLRESIHVDDAYVIGEEAARGCIEYRDIEPIEEENFETISIDVLEAKYQDGQKVTLENLKKKGLVEENKNGIRIVVGKRLSKPLCVYANEYSIEAIKMIVLTGGRVIQLK